MTLVDGQKSPPIRVLFLPFEIRNPKNSSSSMLVIYNQYVHHTFVTSQFGHIALIVLGNIRPCHKSSLAYLLLKCNVNKVNPL